MAVCPPSPKFRGMPGPRTENLRALGLIREAEMLADALRLIAYGMGALGYTQGPDGVTANANEITKRLEALKAILRR
jgi:hypothetical protein